jgi:hypothetical chaperone protein
MNSSNENMPNQSEARNSYPTPEAFAPDVYAIDFGTSNSLLAAANRNGTHPPIPLDAGAPDPTVLRSILYFPDDPGCFIGASALDEYVRRGMQGRLIRSLKRFLPMRDFTGTVIGRRRYRLPELIAAILREMRERADRTFGCNVTRVVLGRPARFARGNEEDQFAEDRLREAAILAGFQDVTFCPEPVAAARDFRDALADPKLVLIGDFGGGTSDFSVVRMHRGTFEPGDVLATGGVSVAGDALDGSIMRHSLSVHFGSNVTYRAALGKNVLSMPTALMAKLCSPAEIALLSQRDTRAFLDDIRLSALGPDDRRVMSQLQCLAEDALGFQLFDSIETAKRQLSVADDAPVDFEYPGIEIHHALHRAAFESGAERELQSIIASLDETLERAGIAAEAIDIVCLTGGTSRVPRIAAALSERFPGALLHRLRGFHSVVQGLAEEARRLA